MRLSPPLRHKARKLMRLHVSPRHSRPSTPNSSLASPGALSGSRSQSRRSAATVDQDNSLTHRVGPDSETVHIDNGPPPKYPPAYAKHRRLANTWHDFHNKFSCPLRTHVTTGRSSHLKSTSRTDFVRQSSHEYATSRRNRRLLGTFPANLEAWLIGIKSNWSDYTLPAQ